MVKVEITVFTATSAFYPWLLYSILLLANAMFLQKGEGKGKGHLTCIVKNLVMLPAAHSFVRERYEPGTLHTASQGLSTDQIFVYISSLAVRRQLSNK